MGITEGILKVERWGDCEEGSGVVMAMTGCSFFAAFKYAKLITAPAGLDGILTAGEGPEGGAVTFCSCSGVFLFFRCAKLRIAIIYPLPVFYLVSRLLVGLFFINNTN
ncbi:MAG TPA: hypothetical protein DCZ63_15080 [Geobacter sp.]|nr:hypothetical protein [Geobacter sp.]